MKLETIIKECQKVKGWFTPAQMRELYPLVKNKKGVLVEIGTYKGRSTLYWRLATRMNIITIDIVQDSRPPDWVPGYEVGAVIQKDILELGRITAIQNDNREVAKKWNKPIDVLFVDGDERYGSIYGDLEAWWPFVKKGGYILVHNYCTGNEDTRRAVNDWKNMQGMDYQLMAEVVVFKK